MQRILGGKKRIFLWTLFFVVACSWSAAASEGPSGARITASVGENTAGGDRALEQRGLLEPDETLETGEDGNCSLLIEEDALLEVCGDTALTMRKREPGGPQIVSLDRGDIRVQAEPRLESERIEIHTPAAIATILGSVIFISVDALGVTTVAAHKSRAMVKSADPNIPGQVIVNPGERVQIGLDTKEMPKQAEPIGDVRVASMAGCLVQFHDVAFASDQKSYTKEKVNSITQADILDGQLPQVAAAQGGVSEMPISDGTDTIIDPVDILTPVDDPIIRDILDAMDNGDMGAGDGPGLPACGEIIVPGCQR